MNQQQILVTSGYNFEGYDIVEYLGFYSGETALGTGFLSSLGAGLADLLGTNSSMYSGKLKSAKEYAIQELMKQVKTAGGNAIIGLDIDYNVFSADIIGVIANGTAVKITKKSDAFYDSQKIAINQTNSSLPFRASFLNITTLSNGFSLYLDVFHKEECPLKGLLANINLYTIFEQSYSCDNVEFLSFTPSSRNHLTSIDTFIEIPKSVSRTLAKVDVVITKYILDSTLYEADQTIISAADIKSDDSFSPEDYIFAIEQLANAIEILNYTKSFNEEHNNAITPELFEILEKTVLMERFYGNQKSSCIQKIKEYLL